MFALPSYMRKSKQEDDEENSRFEREEIAVDEEESKVSQCCIAWSDRLESSLAKLMASPDVDLLINMAILGNTIVLAMTNPLLQDREGINGTLFWFNLAFNILFSVEMLLKIISLGIAPPTKGIRAYVRDPWNVFDAFMVAVGWLIMIPPQATTNSNINTLRALRALRPLRTISRFESIKYVVRGCFAALPLLAAVYLLVFLFIWIFGIVGLLAFNRNYHNLCINDFNNMTEAEYFSYDDPDMAGCGKWRHCPDNFTCTYFQSSTATNVAGWDTIGTSLLNLVQLLTLTGWDFIMYRSMDAASPFAVIYSMIITLMGSYFLMNLIIAVLKLKFARFCKLESARRQTLKSSMGEDGARNVVTKFFTWILKQISLLHKTTFRNEMIMSVKTVLTCIALKSSPGETSKSSHMPTSGAEETSELLVPISEFSDYVHKYFDRISRFQRALMIFRYRVYALEKSSTWTLFTLVCIAASILMLSYEHSNMDTAILWQLVQANWALTGVFVVDVLLRSIPLSVSESFHDGWTLLNVILTGFGIAEAVMEGRSGVWGIQQNLTLRSIRSLRTLRGLIFIQASKPMMSITRIVVQAIVSYAAIAVLIFLFWVVLAIIGMNVFGQLRLDLSYLGYAGYPNFSTFLSSMVVSFQVLTLENYQQTLYSLVRATGWGAVAWFLIWFILGKYTFLSLFLAVTLEAFDDTGEEPTGVPPIEAKRRPEQYLYNAMDSSPGLRRSSLTMTDTPETITTQTSRNRTADTSVGRSEGGTPLFTEISQRTGRIFFGSSSMDRSPPGQGGNKSSSQGSPGSSKRWPSVMNSLVGSMKRKGLVRSGAASGNSSHSPPNHSMSTLPPENNTSSLLEGARHPEGARHMTLSKSRSDPDHGKSGSRAAAAAAAIRAIENPSTPDVSSLRNPGPSRLGLKSSQDFKQEAPSSHFMKQSQSMGGMETETAARRLGRIFEDPSDTNEGHGDSPLSPGDISIGREGVREPRRGADRISPATSDGPMIPSVVNDPDMRLSPFIVANATLSSPGSEAGDSQHRRVQSEASEWRPGQIMGRNLIPGLDGSTWAEMGDDRAQPKIDPDRIPLIGRSLFLPEDSRFRRMCYKFVTNDLFEHLIILIVILDCVALAFDDPRDDPTCRKQQILFYCNVAFTVIVSLEAAMKIVAFSLYMYSSQVVNLVDLFIAIVSILELILETVYPRYSGIKALRAFQPIKMITGLCNLRKVAGNIIEAMTSVGHATAMCTIILVMFATVGVQLFGGRSSACWSFDPDTNNQVIYPVPSVDACQGTLYNNNTGVTTTLIWQNQFPNFDNVGYALLILMVATSLNGYSVFMVTAMSAPILTNREGGVPELNQNWAAFIYFVVFVLFCALILLNIFTGIIFSQFVTINEKEKGSAWLTDKQRQWKLLQEAVFRLKPLDPKVDLPQNQIRRILFSILRHRWFRSLMLTITLLNVIILSMYHYDMSNTWLLALEWANVGFVTAFTLELVMKVIALGPEAYWHDGWNKFDVLVVIVALIDLAVTFIFATTQFRVLRLLAIERVLRAMKLVAALASYQGIKLLYVTLVVSLPAFANIGLLIFLVFFIYAYLGVQAFYNLPLPGSLNYRVNFRSFPNALIALLRIATADNWSDFFFQMIPDYFGLGNVCPAGYDCGSWLSIPYCITFLFFVSFILLNLFMAVIIEAYEKHSEMMHYDKVTPLILDEFVWTWVNYDTQGTASIRPEDFFKLLKDLGQPLGLGAGNVSDGDLQRFALQLKIPLKKGRIPFHQTIYELVKSACEETIPESSVKDELDKAYFRFLKEGGHDDADDAAKDEAALARLAKQVGNWSLYVSNNFSESAREGSAVTMSRQDPRMESNQSSMTQLTSMRSRGPSAIKSVLTTSSFLAPSFGQSPKTPNHLTLSSDARDRSSAPGTLSAARPPDESEPLQPLAAPQDPYLPRASESGIAPELDEITKESPVSPVSPASPSGKQLLRSGQTSMHIRKQSSGRR